MLILPKIGIDDPAKRKTDILQLVEKLPRTQRATLAYLIVFLRLLALHSDVNKMSCLNLGVIFAPSILRKKIESVVCYSFSLLLFL